MLNEKTIDGLICLIDEKGNMEAAKELVSKMDKFDRKEAIDKVLAKSVNGVDFYLMVLGKKESELCFHEKELLKSIRTSMRTEKAKEEVKIIEITNIARKVTAKQAEAK